MTTEATRGPEDAGNLVARLRAEQAAQESNQEAQALLLHECAVAEEALGNEPAAARDYLAAFNADPHFREPLEALVRILTRRKSVKNLGKLLEALTRAAATPEERNRAFRERAAFAQDFEQDLDVAREALDEALAAVPEDATAWLEQELLAAKRGDVVERMRALEARAELAADPTWKGLLMIELAELNAAGGEPERAFELLDAAAALDGQARFETRLVLERLAAKEGNREVLAHALYGQAELLAQALDDPDSGDALGVPRGIRTAEHVADALLRAAELHRRAGQAAEVLPLLTRAAERLASPVIAAARIAALDASGDAEGAAAIATQLLTAESTGPHAAGLWLRVAEGAGLAGDRDGALSALRGALTADPDSIPARVLELDVLGDGQSPGALAAAHELSAESFATAEARSRAYLIAANAWATGAGDVPAARAALSQATSSGLSPATAARVARMLASLVEDKAWYEDATKRLLALGGEPAQTASLWLELGRSLLLRGDVAGAGAAFDNLTQLGDEGDAAWLGRILAVCLPALTKPAPEDDARDTTPGEEVSGLTALPIDALAAVEPDAELARGLTLVAALRCARAGEPGGARERLRKLCESSADDTVASVFLADLTRRAAEPVLAAQTLAAAAAATDDADLSAALHLEAGLVLFRAGNTAEAMLELEAARVAAPRAAAIALSWAIAGADPNTIEGRRRALDSALEAGADPAVIGLERFGLEATSKDGESDDALEALQTVEAHADGDLATAAALGRLVWPAASAERGPVDAALDELASHDGAARSVASAERFRLARELDQDRSLACAHAAAWVVADPKPYAAIEWLAAAQAAEDHEAEVAARRRIGASLGGEARAALTASASLVAMLDQPLIPQPLLAPGATPRVLANLELAPPGCDPRRRAFALQGLDDSLGAEARLEARALSGWSELAAGLTSAALNTFRAAVEDRPDDLASWEGVRAAATALGDHVSVALACAQLGALCKNDARGAEFWEHAGLVLLEHTEAHDDAEIAFQRAFDRDPTRAVAFDKYFRRVRARNEDDRLLQLIDRRLEVADDEAEIGKLFWERARVLRKKGDRDGALAALENVTMLEPDHVGALALAGEINITKGAFAEAAPLLARLATIDEAPGPQRLMSGIAAVDLYEHRLGDPHKALKVLNDLNASGLATLPVRERLARTAANTGAWADATTMFERLMNERESVEGQVEAARLAMAIWRDKIKQPERAAEAVDKLLSEVPDDGEALDLVLTTGFDPALRTRTLGRAKATLIHALAATPVDADRVALLAKIAGAGQDAALRQATLGALLALGRDDKGLSEELERLDARVAARPQIVLDAHAMAEIADADDQGPIAELFAIMAETISLALGPSLVSVGVTKKDRIDARGGHPLRLAVASWMGAVGFEGDFDLYIGGPDPHGVHGISGDLPTIVLGTAITAPLDAAARSSIAREVFALRRGITAVRKRDANTIACVVIAACQEAGLSVPNPPYAMWNEVSRGISKELSRKVKKLIADPCQRIVQSRADARHWADAAVRSLDRMAMIAAGDASLVLSDVLGVPRDRLEGLVVDSPRARQLLAFVLSPSYLDLRKKLGMGVR